MGDREPWLLQPGEAGTEKVDLTQSKLGWSSSRRASAPPPGSSALPGEDASFVLRDSSLSPFSALTAEPGSRQHPQARTPGSALGAGKPLWGRSRVGSGPLFGLRGAPEPGSCRALPGGCFAASPLGSPWPGSVLEFAELPSPTPFPPPPSARTPGNQSSWEGECCLAQFRATLKTPRR